MNKRLLWVAVLLWLSLTLAWCNCNCECDEVVDENEVLDQVTQDCLDKWWTHSLIHSQTAVYGECSFPSWVTCEDQALASWECDFRPNLEEIDTEEERLAGCKQNVQWWMVEFMEWTENVNIEWWDEEEGWASFVRNWLIKYTKDWIDRKMSVECVADFVDWSLSVSYGDPEADEQ